MKSDIRQGRRQSTSLQALAVVFVSVLFFATALAGLYRCFSKPPETGRSTLSAGINGAEQAGDSQEAGTAVPAGIKEHFYTILVCGMDDSNGGSDVNLLVSLDAAGGEIHVMSLPRDTLLNVTWSVKKLNNAYHHGGTDQVREEISRLLGIPIYFCVMVDLTAFEKLVDEIGGVDFEIPANMDYDDPAQDLSIHFEKGLRHLNGEEALKVVRWRKNNDGTGYAAADIGRIATQQSFLMAVAKQALRPNNWDNIPNMAQIFQTYVDTGSLTLANLIWFGEQALTIGSEHITFHTLPGDGAGYYKGVSYYVLYPEEVLAMVNAYFNPYTTDRTLDDLDILTP